MINVKKPYIGQPLTVTHKTGLDLTGATYTMTAKKPSNSIVSMNATRVGSTDKITVTFLAADINESGEWKFQSFVSYGVASTYPCKTQFQIINDLYT